MATRSASVLTRNVESLKQLNALANFSFRTDIALAQWFRRADLWFKEGRVYELEADLLAAYLAYLKFSTLVIHNLPTHPDYNKKNYELLKKTSRQNAIKALQALEKLRPIIDAQFKERALQKERLKTPTRSSSLSRDQDALIYDQYQKPASKEKRDSVSSWVEDQQKLVEQTAALRRKNTGSSRYRDTLSSTSNSNDENWWKVDQTSSQQIVKQNAKPASESSYSQKITSNSYPELKVNSTTTPQYYNNPAYYNSNQYNNDPPQPILSQYYNNAAYYSTNSSQSQYKTDPPPPIPPRPISPSPQSSQQIQPRYNNTVYNEPQTSAPPLPKKIQLVPVIPQKPASTQEMLDQFSNISISDTNRPTATTEDGTPLRQVQIPTSIISLFLKVANENTQNNIETCGILSGTLRKDTFIVTTLLIPKQKGTSDSTETMGEEELFEYQMNRDLLTLGWIHTHPTQTCFMSSIDLHTHSSYQQLLPEAIAIVISPKHDPLFGIFRLTTPPGLDVIMKCPIVNKFHPHAESDLYRDATEGEEVKGLVGHVRMVEGKLGLVDLR
ncbi:hypothetical protein HK098_003883 [Nowakowskiella sp. JEL0407]|nr:hypothetical protein HK098_003883 [Nowakowskiella sp. JEL0407]